MISAITIPELATNEPIKMRIAHRRYTTQDPATHITFEFTRSYVKTQIYEIVKSPYLYRCGRNDTVKAEPIQDIRDWGNTSALKAAAGAVH